MAEVDENTPQYSVAQFFVDDSHEWLGRALLPLEAVKLAIRSANSVGAKIGSTSQVVITDALDNCVWHWQYGKGVVFPPEWCGLDITKPPESRNGPEPEPGHNVET